MKKGYFRIKKQNLEENFYLDENVFVILTPNSSCVHQINSIDYNKKKNEVIKLLTDNNPILKYIGEKNIKIKGNYKDLSTNKTGIFVSKINHIIYIDKNLIIFNFEINYDNGGRFVKRSDKVNIRTL